ncbi:Phosphonates import ATP-binding protein PhnC 1 [Madurella mycetomatis]|uniref:Phosphonates import ATP-binding protein PhnC 1 n=1 Tax=Madurella mycetomatis TaxID=100816 RepID=A0A175W5K5_9PEZI|nr:Phosphonates import ATP-binding protein PhnC 1 [Madurella mycetomatis]
MDLLRQFDGVHRDPEASVFAPPRAPASRQPPPRPQTLLAPRPTSYLDPATGQQMLYYPAPVPAMLNLPLKLSKKPKATARNARRSQIVSAMPEVSRHSQAWLPDPTERLRSGQEDAPFMDGTLLVCGTVHYSTYCARGPRALRLTVPLQYSS